MSKPNDYFQTTQWSVVFRAAKESNVGASEALAEICEAYWQPLYAFARRRGHNQHDAMDITQGFFAHILSKNCIATVDPENGRLRDFLLSSFKNFMSNEWRNRNTLRRGGAMTNHSLQSASFEQLYQKQMADECTPELQFERSWIDTLIRRVIAVLRTEYEKVDKAKQFEALHPLMVPNNSSMSYAEVAEKVGMTKAAVTMSVHRMRKRFGKLLRDEISKTVCTPEEVDEELQRLLQVMASVG